MSIRIKNTMMAVTVAAILATVSANAAVIYNLSFDNDGTIGGPANTVYALAPGDVNLTGGAINRLDPTNGSPVPQIVASTGLQGGKALLLTAPGAGNNTGYFAPNTGATLTIPNGGGLTLEALININTFSPNLSNPWGPLAGLAGQFAGAGGIQPDLRLSGGTAGNPGIEFALGGQAGADIIYQPSMDWTGVWHHVAGVYTKDAGAGQSRLAIYLDGVSVTNLLYTTSAVQTLAESGYAFGVDAPNYALMGRVLDGQIDAVAVSSDILGAGSFLLPTPVPEPSVLGLAGLAGGLLLLRRCRRQC